MKKIKIAYITLGCHKNLIDSEIALSAIEKEGYEITDNIRIADIAVINTCTFIEEATNESINKIIEVGKYKDKLLKKIIVTGCMGQRYKEDIIKQLPEVDCVLGTGNILEIIKAIKSKDIYINTKGINSKEPFNPRRNIQTPHSYVFLRIAEGCDNFCSYCIIPKLRGRYRSRKIISIIQEIKELVKKGYKEIDIIAEDVTKYGEDIGTDLSNLLDNIENIEGDFKVRLLYCYPENISDKLIATIKNSSKILKYIDIPIQHFSDRILKKMNRKSRRNELVELLNKLKENIPDLFIRTSIIVGFPSESEDDFDKLKNLVNMGIIYHVGVFEYSREEGTKAYAMKNQISKEVKMKRKNELEALQQNVVNKINNNMLGKTFNVIVDGVADDGIFYKGRTYFQAPEIDNQTFIIGLKDLEIGDKVQVRIINLDGNNLIGEIVN